MTAQYNPAEVERLIGVVRRIASAERRPCSDCSCYACADCHCSLEHARRDRELAMSDQLEAARDEVTYWRAESERLAKAANLNQAAVDGMRPVFDAAVRWRNEKARMASHLWGLEDQSLYETAGKVKP